MAKKPQTKKPQTAKPAPVEPEVLVLPEGALQVRAKEFCFHKGIRHRKDDVFVIGSRSELQPWMEPVRESPDEAPAPDKTTPPQSPTPTGNQDVI